MKNNGYKVNIRSAEINDRIWLSEHDRHITPQILDNKIKNKEIYIVEINDQIIGWLRYNLFWDNVPFLNLIYLLEEYRQKGIGKILIEYWENEMKQNGYKNVLTSTQSNEES